MLMRSVGLHLNALNLTPYSNLSSRMHPWWKLHLVSMSIEVRFDQGPSMNGINFKIVYRCCGMNVFKDSYNDLALLRKKCCHCKSHAMTTGYNQLWCLVYKLEMKLDSSSVGCFTLHHDKRDWFWSHQNSQDQSNLDSCFWRWSIHYMCNW